MRYKYDERGTKTRAYERGDGVRRRFYEAMKASRFHNPRRVARHHAHKWYCDGHLDRRPTYGVWACALLAEHLLANARASGNPPLVPAAKFYAATRRAMQSIVTHHRVTRNLGDDGVRHARALYRKLCDMGTTVLEDPGSMIPRGSIAARVAKEARHA